MHQLHELYRSRPVDEAFVALLRRERRAYALPPRLPQLAERFLQQVLELLFPHYVAEVGCRPEEVAAESAALRGLLTLALQVPGFPPRSRQHVVEEFLAALPGIRTALLLDAEATYEGDPAARSVDEVILAYPGFHATAVHRVAHFLHSADVPLLPRVLAEHAHRLTGIDIHPGARIGRRFAIDHGTGVVVGETAVLGADVRLYQGVTLGAARVSKGLAHSKRHPTIGDDVVVCANATILGGDTVIGSGSRIGGNVWLTRSVPANSVVTDGAAVRRRDGSDAHDLLEFYL